MQRLRKIVCLLVIPVLLSFPVSRAWAGAWRGDGTPLTEVAAGKFKGDVFVAGGHGYTKENPYREAYNLPEGLVRFARLYIPVWNYDAGDELEPVLNGRSLGKLQGMPNYLAAFGVAAYALDVTENVKMNSQNTLEVRCINQNGGPYGAYLVVAYENPDKNVVQFWLTEGNRALSPNQGQEQTEAVFDAFSGGNDSDRLVDTKMIEKATLHTLIITGTEKEKDRLSFNNRLLGIDVARGKSGPYTDYDRFNVTALLEPQRNTVLFERGEEKYLHPMIGLLVINYKPETAAVVRTYLSIDRSITQRNLQQAQSSWQDRFIGQIPRSVFIVLGLTVFMALISWRKLRRKETL